MRGIGHHLQLYEAIYRAVQNHGLHVQYSSNDALRLFIHQLMALAFFPKWVMSIHYSELKHKSAVHSLSWTIFQHSVKGSRIGWPAFWWSKEDGNQHMVCSLLYALKEELW